MSAVSQLSGLTAQELGVAGTDVFRRGLNGISSWLKLSARDSERRRGEILGILGLEESGEDGSGDSLEDLEDTVTGI